MLLNLDKATVTQSDIGIVSPYNLQCKKLKQNCKKNGYDDIVIGSAEVFQGQEKSVMIVSTVRSGKKFLGDFLSNAQVHASKSVVYCKEHGIFVHKKRPN